MSVGSRRFLNVHEYASMEIMRSSGIPVPKTQVAHSTKEAIEVYKSLIGAGNECVIKAMVLTGGRGLGHFSNGYKGGVHVVKNEAELTKAATKMIGSNLITKQTGKHGLPCNKVMIAEKMFLKREMYLSMMLDRSAGGPMFVASPAGGTSIEDVAEESPELIFTRPININDGITADDTEYLAKALGFVAGTPNFEECRDVMKKLYQLFREKDCTLLEINPLAETPDGHVMVCDAKINFDDNASYRQAAVFDYRDRSQEDKREVEVCDP
jgi:succinyl-CoA synthetase beta subunit